MNIDSIYSDNQDRLSPFNNITKATSKMSKLKNDKHHKSPQHTPKLSIQQIEKQIIKQISISQETIKNFDQGLSAIVGKKGLHNYYSDSSQHKSTTSLVNIEKLRGLQQSIRRKDQIIRQIEQDIKMLKNGTYYDTRQKSDESNFQKFINQIKQQRQGLIQSQNLLMKKVREVNSKKQVMKSAETKYRQKCKREGIQFISFQAFKQTELKRRKQAKKMDKYKKVSHKKMGSSIKQYPNQTSKNQVPNVQNSINGADSKRMKDLLNRKNVAQTALKTAKKKHILQLNDLYGKRDFLLDQNQDLEQKLLLKENQLRMAQQKFSESRGSTSTKKISQRRYKTERNL